LIKKSLYYFDPKRQKASTKGWSSRDQPLVSEKLTAQPTGCPIRALKHFKKLVDDWSVLPCPLFHDSKRLLVEEFVQLQNGAAVVLLVSDLNPYFGNSWLPLLRSAHSTAPSHCYKFGDRYFYSVRILVDKNPYAAQFQKGQLTKLEIKEFFTEGGDGALSLLSFLVPPLGLR
jgi:hypothetical protein